MGFHLPEGSPFAPSPCLKMFEEFMLCDGPKHLQGPLSIIGTAEKNAKLFGKIKGIQPSDDVTTHPEKKERQDEGKGRGQAP